jgi:exonuclease SbcD
LRGAPELSLRILHTADWHLGDRLGGVDRLPDQFARLREVVGYAEARHVDALLVCGDVLEERRPERLAAIVSQLGELLAPSVERGMQCVFLAGNHDSAHTFELLSAVQQLLGERHASRVHFVREPALVPLTAGAGGDLAATLVALPYPSVAAYSLPADLGSVERKRAALSAAVAACRDALSEQADREHPGLPILMAGHFLLGHVTASTGRREVIDAEDVHVADAGLDRFAYVALGHVHQPVVLDEQVRYSGALDRVDFGEADEPRHVVLAEIDDAGGLALEELPLDATPMRRIEIGALDEIAEQEQALDEPTRTIVKLELRLDRADNASVWLAEARAAFARRFEPIDLIRLDDPDPPLLTGEIEPAGTTETVRAYVAEQLSEEDPDRTTLLAMVEQLLDEEGLLGR